ncbi:MAG: DEAD/DEAH box helicase, partial [Alistipes sp.]|nr:DEAD/DEAH box helicase [Alistipes sp.]
MSPREQLAQFVAGSKNLGRLCRAYQDKRATVHLEELVGGALSFYAASAVARTGGVHVFVAEDRDAAAYLLNDFYNLLDEQQVCFFPSSWKRSAAYGAEDAQGVVQRTATMNALRNFSGKGYLVVCTYPEALAERVADAETLQQGLIQVRVGDRISIEVLEQALTDAAFSRVDFVYEPGQYSVRGGIVDVFSFSESKPYRIDLFGDEVDSIRRFEISSQLSSEKLSEIAIIPDMNVAAASSRVSLARFAGEEAAFWFFDPDFVFRKINDVRRKTLGDLEQPETIDTLMTSRNGLLADLAESRIFMLRDNLPERPATVSVKFSTAPQPRFNKNFEMLADDMIRNALRGYETFILSENKVQVERLENIFHQIGRGQAVVRAIGTTLHEGFVDNELKLCLYTDHQIFDRYQRYRINGEIRRDEQMTVAELNQLRPGDYVVHIDHGVGRFDGLVKIAENGKTHEAIKLVYKDGDVLFVNVHSLHRISRYRAGDGEPPKIYKLGNGAWQKLKNATKKAVKDISRELIALYARRKASKGFAFSPDSYLQHELEASFRWEDTPDQQAAIAAVKKDMESDQPMDRLVCGDVGFGKTEVAIRAAFKAATDGKQVAVLVPTTILALQHYRSFSERLRGFPVKIEYINRTKSAREVTQIREELASGKIDILIGTHKMLGKQILFRDLGLLIIDEEQKFGVAAKEKLTQMSVSVDTLTLTATPIPRTLQFSLMGSRDLSVISTPPPNRQPILTESHVFSEEIVRDAIEAELARGGQVYFVHNRVEDLSAIQGMIARLCPKARVGVGHGKMPAEQLEKLVMDFIYGEFDILLSTTIVENGIDIPNANTIIIDNAQNFG